MNAHAVPLKADEATVRTFLEIIHRQAAHALQGLDQPGDLQLVRIHPGSEATVSTRFKIGDVDGMVQAALDAASGRNVYIETRTVAEGTKGRGKTDDTRAVFAFVVDSAEEQEAWRDYLRGQGVECTDVFDRGAFRSIYVRDPDGHIVELATRAPGFPA